MSTHRFKTPPNPTKTQAYPVGGSAGAAPLRGGVAPGIVRRRVQRARQDVGHGTRISVRLCLVQGVAVLESRRRVDHGRSQVATVRSVLEGPCSLKIKTSLS